jgi:cell division protein FtsI/penicillin-binding protein 2
MLGQRGRMKLRLYLLAAVFACAGVALTARTAYIQIVDQDHYQAEARNEHFGQQEIRAPRGAILDRNGYPLATTVDAFDVFIDREVWQDLIVARRSADFIAPIVKRQPEDLVNEVRQERGGLYRAYTGLGPNDEALLPGGRSGVDTAGIRRAGRRPHGHRSRLRA